ncbi:MAG: hypothetical protein Q8P41_09490 [Pseudomonadota bacterium]|nr:hypothetical protein [Pseudomonadota bacterium]
MPELARWGRALLVLAAVLAMRAAPAVGAPSVTFVEGVPAPPDPLPPALPGAPMPPSRASFDAPELVSPASDPVAPVGYASVEPGVDLVWVMPFTAGRDLRAWVEIRGWEPGRREWIPLMATYTDETSFHFAPPYLRPDRYYAWRVTAVDTTEPDAPRAESVWSMFWAGEERLR